MRIIACLALMAACGGGIGGSSDPCGPAKTVSLSATVDGRGFSLRTPDANVHCHAQMELLFRWPDGHTPLPKGVYGGPNDDVGMEFGVSAGMGGVYPVGTPKEMTDGNGTTWMRAFVDQAAKDQPNPGRYYISLATRAPVAAQATITYRPWTTAGKCSELGQGCGVGVVEPTACCDGLWCQNAMCVRFKQATEACGTPADPPCEPNVLACINGKCTAASR